MFWTDWGHKIERATLSGTQRVVIVTSNLFWAFRLDLDRRNRLVFWVDWWWDRVESVDYHGNNRKLLFHSQQLFVSPFPGVTFFSSYLFVPGWGARGHGIYKFSATDANGTVMSGVTIGTFIRGLVAYDSSRQLPGMHWKFVSFNSIKSVIYSVVRDYSKHVKTKRTDCLYKDVRAKIFQHCNFP